jgi:FKBP-type peptidyl-prolyl cis-trans isomerase
MENSATGLYYMITEQGKGRKIQTGDTLKMDYKVSLLDGTLCYSSNEDGPKTFVAGKGQIEPGMEEGILLLHDGASACFILMPHLAHGLIGDGKQIPARATIVYDIQHIQIQNKHDIN